VVDRMLHDTHVTARGRLPVLGQDSPASQIAERHGACDTAAIGAFVMGRIKQKPTCGLPREGREAGINPSDDPACSALSRGQHAGPEMSRLEGKNDGKS
jgi:hypothetical protein